MTGIKSQTHAFEEYPARAMAARWWDTILLGEFLAILSFGPLSFGAVEPWSILVFRAGALLIFLTWAAQKMLRDDIRIRTNPLYPPICLFGMLVCLQWALNWSAYRYDTYTEFLDYVAFALLFFVTVQYFDSDRKAKILLGGLTVFGVLLSLFAMIQGFAGNGRIYWLRYAGEGAFVYGPYVNHNHFAGLMEMLTPIPMVWCCMTGTDSSKRFLLGFCATVMGASIFLSQSRGGMIAFACQIVLFGLYFAIKHNGSDVLKLLGILIVLSSLLFWLGESSLIQRIASIARPSNRFVAGERLQIIRDSMSMVRARPLLGWGAGAFPTVYPQYRTFYDNVFVNEAHNDYLQLLVETGIIGFGLILWLAVLLYWRGWRELNKARTLHVRVIKLSALLGCSGILVHSFSDFNMHVPSNAALFFILCGLATNQMGEAAGRAGMGLLKQEMNSRDFGIPSPH